MQVTGSAEATSESTATAGVRDEDSESDLGADSGVKVRVSKVKKVVLDDDDDDDDLEMKETDLDAKEMEELNMEKRLRLATKKMEQMVKEQLRNSGVVPSGLKNNLIKINIQVENFLPAKLAGLVGENPENPRKSLAARAWRLTRQDHPAYNPVSHVGYSQPTFDILKF